MALFVNAENDVWMDGVTVAAQQLRLQQASALLCGSSATGTTGIAARAGVRPGLASPLLVQASSGMSITVNAGTCWVQGTTSATAGLYTACLDTTGTITVATSDPTNPRIDNVIAQVTDVGSSSSTTVITLQTGTAAPSPAAPSLPANSLLLATVAVAAGATSIVGGNITDKRVFTAANGGIIPVRTSADQPPAADTPALRWRLDVTAAAGSSSPMESSTDGTTWHPVFDASAVPASTTSAITAAYGRLLVCTSSTRPGSPATGQAIEETDTGHVLVYIGGSWTQIYPVVTPTWTNMTIAAGFLAGSPTPQYLYNTQTGTVYLRGTVTVNSTVSGSATMITGLPSVSIAQYLAIGISPSTTLVLGAIGSSSLTLYGSFSSSQGISLGGSYVVG